MSHKSLLKEVAFSHVTVLQRPEMLSKSKVATTSPVIKLLQTKQSLEASIER